MNEVNVLVVGGAGAVGQVYGYHLQRGGARVGLLVRPKAVAACERGTVLYPLALFGSRRSVTFRPDVVLSSLEDVAAEARARAWDEVWFCVPADALDEAWLATVAAAVGKARVVALPPGIESEERLRRAFPGCEVVPALISIVSYQAPLPGEEISPPGIAFYFPPAGPTVFGGPHGREVAKNLARGGCPAVGKKDIRATSAFASAVLMPVVAGLEAMRWSLRAFRRSDVPLLVARAAQEATAITADILGVRRPFLSFLVTGLAFRLAAWLAPKLAPFDLEAYLKHHFSKVGEQTRLLFAEYGASADKRGLPKDALASLLARADAERGRSLTQ